MFVALLLIALWLALLIGSPLAFIWSLNTLFSLSIEYGIDTWLAAFIVMMIAGAIRINSGKSE